MKVSMLFYGQPRFIDNEDVFRIYNNIINTYDVDVFCHLWWSDKIKSYKSSSWSDIVSNTDINTFGKVKSKYNPIIIECDDEMDLTLDINIRNYLINNFKNNIHCKDNNFKNMLSHFYSIKRVSEIFEKYKNDNDIEYDLVILCRYDTILTNFPDLNLLDKSKFYLSGEHDSFPDMINIFGVNFLEWSKNIYDDVKLVYTKVDTPYPEQFKYKSFLNRFSHHDMIGLPIRAFAIRS